jgi:Cu(I)/Ag(I) efflux system membrane fusion protein
MDLVPVKNTSSSGMSMASDAVQMSSEAMALANVETAVVGEGSLNRQIRLFGKIAPDQRTQQSQTSYVAGRIERLFVNAVGDHISRGQTIAVIYSPELYTAEQELVEALQFDDSRQRKVLVEAAVEKLRLLNVDNGQIRRVLKSRKPSPFAELKANTTGTVIAKSVNQGDYVNQGAVLMQIANLSTVWAMFQAYENDLPFIHVGERIQFTAEAIPGKVFIGTVSFVDPIIDDKSRTAGVRIVLANRGGLFKPEMLVSGYLSVSPGRYRNDLVVPKSAVLWTGKRSVVYVKEPMKGMTAFSMRQVTLGPSLQNGYVVLSGLSRGEQIVVNGTFAVDASAQLEGKPSMMDH